MKKITLSFSLALLACLLIISGAMAQSGQLTLKLSRDWGYGGFNNDIQGLFTMHVTGPTDLAKVTFYIDQTVIGEANQSPFNLQFTTDSYALGWHDLYAVGTSTSGQEYKSNVVRAEFVAAKSIGKTIFPILGVILGIVVLAAIIPIITVRRKKLDTPMGEERHYGVGGGAICPRCQRPFALSLFSPNLGIGSKLAVCPYCGKVSMVRPQSLDKLRAAEKAELEGQKTQVTPESEEEKLKKEINDSKYQGF